MNDSLPTMAVMNGKRNEPPTSSLPLAKRIQPLIQPLNLSVATPLAAVTLTAITTTEDDSNTALSSPANSLSNDVISSSSTNGFTAKSTKTTVWDESVTEILLAVAKQHDTRAVKINTLRTYLEEKLGCVELLCLYRGFKSEPKLTFQGTPWEHYQRFLPVLFTLLTLENMTV